jgi:hypothetical protein
MRSHTQTVTIQASPDAVYAFVVDPRHLPRWASTFAPEIQPAPDEHWSVPSPAGEIYIRYDADPLRRTVDFHMRPALPKPGLEGLSASRIVPNGPNAEYVFTMFQFEGMPEEVWQGQLEELPRELERLKQAVEAAG